MGPGTIKKKKKEICESELFGIRTRKGCRKPAVELRLPGKKEKIWRVMDDLESAKRFVKLVCMYTDRKKEFPANHPNLPHLKAFRKNEFESFIWEEFQGHDATELFQDIADPEDGIDQGTRVEPMMPTYAPESSCAQFEVEPNSLNPGLPQSEAFAFGLGGDSRAGAISLEDSRPPFAPTQAGDVQVQFSVWTAQFERISFMDGKCLMLVCSTVRGSAMACHFHCRFEKKPCRFGLFQLTLGGLCLEQIYAQLQRERWELEYWRRQLSYERLLFASVNCGVLRQRGAREGKKATVEGVDLQLLGRNIPQYLKEPRSTRHPRAKESERENLQRILDELYTLVSVPLDVLVLRWWDHFE